jgi:hypothetical protein
VGDRWRGVEGCGRVVVQWVGRWGKPRVTPPCGHTQHPTPCPHARRLDTAQALRLWEMLWADDLLATLPPEALAPTHDPPQTALPRAPPLPPAAPSTSGASANGARLFALIGRHRRTPSQGAPSPAPPPPPPPPLPASPPVQAERAGAAGAASAAGSSSEERGAGAGPASPPVPAAPGLRLPPAEGTEGWDAGVRAGAPGPAEALEAARPETPARGAWREAEEGGGQGLGGGEEEGDLGGLGRLAAGAASPSAPSRAGPEHEPAHPVPITATAAEGWVSLAAPAPAAALGVSSSGGSRSWGPFHPGVSSARPSVSGASAGPAPPATPTAGLAGAAATPPAEAGAFRGAASAGSAGSVAGSDADASADLGAAAPPPPLFMFLIATVVLAQRRHVLEECADSDDVLKLFQVGGGQCQSSWCGFLGASLQTDQTRGPPSTCRRCAPWTCWTL